MNLNNAPASVEAFKLHSEYQRLREMLLQDQFVDRLGRPLAYWALPSDRRLPLAFLGRTIRDLLDTSFEDLSATPGIGQKKIGTFVALLARATKKHPPAVTAKANYEKHSGQRTSRDESCFDPSTVSEALWELWRETVRRHDMDQEKLGRLASSLQSLPTVIWNTPLSEYAGYTVAEIRQMKTHGEKRIRTILQVFHAVHQALANAPVQEHLAVLLAPRPLVEVDRCVSKFLESNKVPSRAELRDRVVVPLVNQLRLDLGTTVGKLVEGRLGIAGDPQPVRQQSRRMGVTRARVYQLLENCAMAMDVRWPEGGPRLRLLERHLATRSATADRIELLRATIELVYPDQTATVHASNGHSTD
ncbi:MAG TPA: hypothetical protein VHX65_18915 [Pirellulales bacterium]|jgi:hypothetical protein|nr:hypothetical protein [Pirellulales bacterium]